MRSCNPFLRGLGAALCATLLSAVAPGLAAAADPPAEAIIVRFDDDASAAERRAARRAADVQREDALPLPDVELVAPRGDTTVAEALAELARSPDVISAEPDTPRNGFAVYPNDLDFLNQWGLENRAQFGGTAGADIHAPSAWSATTGSASIGVAVIDSGVELSHPDLAPNITVKASETPANGIDNNANGLIDDARGWDYVDDDADPTDLHGHGTHVAGIVGARGNDGYGVTGVAWQTGLLPLRILDAAGSGFTSDAISAYVYAAQAGARIVNASFGGGDYSVLEETTIRMAANVLFVVAAGNSAKDNDVTKSYPCAYDLPNVICVAASDTSDNLASFSNYGATTVDLAAPGVDIRSDWKGGTFAWADGTSMAAPHVAGAAALVLAQRPELNAAQLRQVLIDSAQPVAGLAGRVATGGRLDAARALGTAAPVPPAPPAPAAPPAPRAPAATPPDRTAPTVTLTVNARGSLRTTARRGLRARIGCSERCSAKLDLRVDAATARRLKLGSVATTLGSISTSISAGGERSATVKLTARAARSLRRTRRSIRITINATAADRAGNRRKRSARTTLKR